MVGTSTYFIVRKGWQISKVQKNVHEYVIYFTDLKYVEISRETWKLLILDWDGLEYIWDELGDQAYIT